MLHISLKIVLIVTTPGTDSYASIMVRQDYRLEGWVSLLAT